ncbi:MAG: sulfurtransferase TusA family protein [Gammaproteobacteria bacterium]|nr:sulfurtransferase TusA family protein [Gammaproteobacteria bacterium]
MIEFQTEIDARGLNCPMPVMKVKKELKHLSKGDVLHVIATDPASVQDMAILLASLVDEMLETSEGGGEYHFYIKKS